MIVKADAVRLPFRDHEFDLAIGSPSYIDARLYLEDGLDLGISRDTQDWVDWMLAVTTEALRVSKGLVLWVVSGVTRGWNYQPGPEGLLWEWWKIGGECHCLRPVIWHRSGIPGSGHDQWFRADTEYVLAFKRPGKLPWADNTANGQAPKWAPGGEMSHRLGDGARVNQWGSRDSAMGRNRDGTPCKAGRPSHIKGKRGRLANGRLGDLGEGPDSRAYTQPAVANPGNLFSTGPSGGNHLGNPLAHLSEAPYPVDVPAWFIASHCRPGGRVLDPFSGSATTGEAALSLGRRYVGCDLRMSQCRLGRKRLGTVTPGFCFTEEVSISDPDVPEDITT